MLPIDIVQIKQRADAVNLSLKKLAGRAGCDFTSVYRAASGKSDLRSRTVNKLAEALIAEERRLLAHLIALHGGVA